MSEGQEHDGTLWPAGGLLLSAVLTKKELTISVTNVSQFPVDSFRFEASSPDELFERRGTASRAISRIVPGETKSETIQRTRTTLEPMTVDVRQLAVTRDGREQRSPFLRVKALPCDVERSVSPGYVFISYSSKDVMLAHSLQQDLEARSIEVWRDKTRLYCGAEFAKDIEAALKKAHVVLVIYSKNSLESDYVHGEAMEARATIRDRMMPLLAADTQPQDLPINLRHKVHVLRLDDRDGLWQALRQHGYDV